MNGWRGRQKPEAEEFRVYPLGNRVPWRNFEQGSNTIKFLY